MPKDAWMTPFKKGFIVCFGISGAIAGVAVYFNNQILELKNGEIKRLETSLSSREDHAEKYHKEQVLRRQAEIKATQLDERLSGLLAAKWPEHYEAERIQRQTAEEKLAIVEARYKDISKAVEDGKANPSKDLEIKYLTEELKVTRSEADKLRALYTQEKGKPPVIVQIPVINSTATDSRVFEMVAVSAPGLISQDVRGLLIDTYKGSKKRITITQLAAVTGSMFSGDVVKTVESIGENIVDDGNPASLQALIGHLFSGDRQRVMKVLMDNRKKSEK